MLKLPRVYEKDGALLGETAAGVYRFNLVDFPAVRVWRLERRGMAGWVRWQCDDPEEGIYCEDSDGEEAERCLPYVEPPPCLVDALLAKVREMVAYRAVPLRASAPR